MSPEVGWEVDALQPVTMGTSRISMPDSLEAKVREIFLVLRYYFGISFYEVVNYHTKEKTGHDLAQSILLEPKLTLESLEKIFGPYVVEEVLIPCVLKPYTPDIKSSRALLVRLCKNNDRDGVREFFAIIQ